MTNKIVDIVALRNARTVGIVDFVFLITVIQVKQPRCREARLVLFGSLKIKFFSLVYLRPKNALTVTTDHDFSGEEGSDNNSRATYITCIRQSLSML